MNPQLNFLPIDLNKLSILLQNKVNKILVKSFDITYSQFLILHSLHILPKPYQQDISKHIGYTSASISKSLDKLFTMAYINREFDLKNKRANKISLTKAGRDIFEKSFEHIQSEFSKIISSGDNKILSKVVSQAIENLM